ncbi:DUF3759 domain-containing protein, partial [Aspergillus novofumigatus IBT 16806]
NAKDKISHELIAAAVSYEAASLYEDQVAENGFYTDLDICPPESHEKAKEVLAAIAGGILDREVETRGLDFMNRERAKRHAEHQLTEAYSQNY